MSNCRKQNSYSVVLSAVICLSFNLSLIGQTAIAIPAAPQPDSLLKQQDSIARQRQSIALQQQSIERQRAVAGPAPRSPAAFAQSANPFDCEPVPAMQLENAVSRASQAYHVQPDLIHAVIRQESGGYPCAVSQKGAMGLMQLMPEMALEMGAAEPFDVVQNVSAGTRLLSELLQRYKGDLIRTLGAYNAGPAAVDRTGVPPPFPETIHYIQTIMDRLKPSADPKLFPLPVR